VEGWLCTAGVIQSLIVDSTPSIPNFQVFIKEFVRICKNAQLGSKPDLNHRSNELFCIQNGMELSRKTYTNVIRLDLSNFHVSCFCMLELADI
jgi:hypothetical protein